MSSGSVKDVSYKMCLEIIYLMYMYKKDLALNNLQWLIRHKSKPNQTKSYIYIYIYIGFSLVRFAFMAYQPF